jgi:hypothetical protein
VRLPPGSADKEFVLLTALTLRCELDKRRKLRKTEWLCAAVLVNRRWHGLASYWRLWRTPFRARFPAASLPAPPLHPAQHPHTTTCHPTWPGPDVGLATGRGRSASCLGGHCGPDIVVRGSAVLSHNHNNGNVVEWRAELVANARRVHERWMTNQRKLLWSTPPPLLPHQNNIFLMSSHSSLFVKMLIMCCVLCVVCC